MRCLIRTLKRQGKNGLLFQDRHFNGETLTIGRSADQALFLPDLRVALNHAVITELRNGRFLVQAKSLTGVRVNSRLVQSSAIGVGDVLTIGGTEIRLIEPPSGVGLALEVEQHEIESDTPTVKSVMTLEAAGLRKRRWSWLAFWGVLVLFFLLPASYVYMYDTYESTAYAVAAAVTGEPEDEIFIEMPSLPTPISDRFWNSGTIASAHHFFRQNCTACHQEPFERVTSQACVNCHKKTHPHADPDFFDIPLLHETRCGVCHAEHNGKRALIRRDDTLCTQCHQDLSARASHTEVGDASDFGTNHPPFRVTLQIEENGIELTERLSMDAENFTEQSNLKFPHDLHLRQQLSTFEGIKDLTCDDCHKHIQGRAEMTPITYENSCAECHPLVFEPTDDERVLPHGKINEIMFTLQEYYGNRALEGGFHDIDVPDIVRKRREAGGEFSPEELMVALDWAREKSELIGEEVFEFSTCVLCHTVDRIQEFPPRWSIRPVYINRKWLPKGNFTHEKHMTMGCFLCHAAPESSQSSDIMLPFIDTCQECHGGVHSPDKIQSTCVDCHNFHVATEFTMGQEPEL